MESETRRGGSQSRQQICLSPTRPSASFGQVNCCVGGIPSPQPLPYLNFSFEWAPQVHYRHRFLGYRGTKIGRLYPQPSSSLWSCVEVIHSAIKACPSELEIFLPGPLLR